MGCLVALCSSAYAVNTHVHPEDKTKEAAASAAAPAVQAKYAGFCEIEIVNQSSDDVRVSGTFDDGAPLYPFTVYSYEAPHYISLFYYGYCHYGMDLYIDSYYGYTLYSAYTRRESTIRIADYLNAKAKAELVQH